MQYAIHLHVCVFGGSQNFTSICIKKNVKGFVKFVYGQWQLNGRGLTTLIYFNTLKTGEGEFVVFVSVKVLK